jgi:dUTP pyrophosphatase
MENQINYSKTRKVKSPERGTARAAGIDFFVPEFDKTFLEELKTKNPDISSLRDGVYQIVILTDRLLIGPGQRVLIPAGIKMNILPGRALMAKNKSGVGSKKGLSKLAELVDEDYQGEIHISVFNSSNEIVEILPNEKLIQFAEIGVFYSTPNEVSESGLFTNTTERGDKGFGHTNEK